MIGHHPAPAVPAADAMGVRTVAIEDARVVPRTIVVAPGTTVSWRNLGRNRHTVTADDGRFDSGILAPGDDFAVAAPAATGTYSYHCTIHAYITGTMTVSPVGLDAPATVLHGRAAALRGEVPGAPAGTEVRIERRVPGAWEPVATVVTDAAGAFAARTGPLTARTALRAVTGAAVSPSVRATVRPSLAVARTGRTVRVGLRPARRAPMALQRLDLDTYLWRDVAARRAGADGRARFRLTGAGVYRVSVAAGGGLEAAATAPVQFRPARYHE